MSSLVWGIKDFFETLSVDLEYKEAQGFLLHPCEFAQLDILELKYFL